MAQIRRRDTIPEKVTRSILHRSGFRFRMDARGLPGRPDIVLAKYRTVVFVHGCFWHRHAECANATTPSSNRDFWLQKFEQNMKRDRRNIVKLRKEGWKVFVVWECDVEDGASLNLLLKYLKARRDGVVA